jgi:hypothetical protein
MFKISPCWPQDLLALTPSLQRAQEDGGNGQQSRHSCMCLAPYGTLYLSLKREMKNLGCESGSKQ